MDAVYRSEADDHIVKAKELVATVTQWPDASDAAVLAAAAQVHATLAVALATLARR